jgi:hypothetical protein
MATTTKSKAGAEFTRLGIDKAHLDDGELAEREAMAARIGAGEVLIGTPERARTMWLPESEKDFFRAALLGGIGTWVGFDWHEPDQCEVDAVVTGTSFDNAGIDGEKTVHLKVDGKRVASVNLATLCALATSAVMRQLVPREEGRR